MNRYILLFLAFTFSLLTSWVSVSAKNDDSEKQLNLWNTGSKNTTLISTLEKWAPEQDDSKMRKTNSWISDSTWAAIETNDTERRKIELKLKRDINSYIIESYKAQGNKIIKDLSSKLTKTIPEQEERKLAYEKIQESLKIRLEKTEEIENSNSKKEILQEFLKHLIQLLDKKIDEIEN